MLHDLSLYLTAIFILVFLFLLVRFFWIDPERRGAIERLFHKTKKAFDKESQPENPHSNMSTSSQMQPVTLADVTRYRLHYGANLGSVFILERWLTGCMFPTNTTGQSELSAVQGWIQQEGIQKTQARFENHWKTYVSDADLDWLKNVAKCTTVRLPIGYFTLGPPYCVGTPFDQSSAVYQNAWAAVQGVVARCACRGIGVLIDLHGVPGGANPDIHSGTDSGKAEFWTSQNYRQLATRCLCFIAQQTKAMGGVVGVQIVNEAETNAPGMYDWYSSVLSELSRIDPTMPIYVSDGWNLQQAITWTQEKNTLSTGKTNPVVIDTHLYFCFADADKQETAQQITCAVPTTLCELDGKDGDVVNHGAAQVVVGEYSCVLDDQTWAKSTGPPKDQLVHDFGNSECKRFQQRAGGSCFWTYRMDWMDGGQWGFKQMAQQGAVAPPLCLTLTADDIGRYSTMASSQQAQRKQNSVSAHNQYWDTNYPGHYEHWRFDQGWDIGYGDALAFFQMRTKNGFKGADKIGMLDLYVLKRLRESGQSGSYVWEFEQGLRQGMSDFYACVSV